MYGEVATPSLPSQRRPEGQTLPGKRRVLIIGAQFAGLHVARKLRRRFNVTVVDAKEYFEYTPGILRAYVKPTHYENLSFMLEPVLVQKMKCQFICGEVQERGLLAEERKVIVKHLVNGHTEVVHFDFCVVCSGCNFGPHSKWGESLWFPTIHEAARPESDWRDLDERYHHFRKAHILREHNDIQALDARRGKILVDGAGFIGVEWITDLQFFFTKLQLTIVDFFPTCLGPLPKTAAEYCKKYMTKVGIAQYYNTKYSPQHRDFWKTINLPDGADKTYRCNGVKASNYFIPEEIRSEIGPCGGGWIHFNQKMQVTRRPAKDQVIGEVWAKGCVFAVGDCNYGAIGNPKTRKWVMPQIPKVCFPAEEQAALACTNICRLEDQLFAKSEIGLKDTRWPWGAGMYVTSLGAGNSCFVLGVNDKQHSGRLCCTSWIAACQKTLIERTKMWECKDMLSGKMIWYFVHHKLP